MVGIPAIEMDTIISKDNTTDIVLINELLALDL